MDVEAIETAGVFDHRGIARDAHRTQDLGDRSIDALIGVGLKGQQRIQRAEEFGFARIEAADGGLAHGQILTV